MKRGVLGTLLGLGVGVTDVLFMLPLQFPDRPAALLGHRRAFWSSLRLDRRSTGAAGATSRS